MASNQQIIKNQTCVSTILATHLLSKKQDSNVVFSPVSIHAAVSVLAAGAKGRTLDQLLAFLKANTNEELNSFYSQTIPSILADGSLNGGPRLAFANGVWVEKTLSLKPSFKKVVDTVYQAACEQVDFKNKAEEVVHKVNLWAEKQTNGLIKDVLDAESVDEFTRFIFANAVYFKGAWSDRFDPSMTIESEFHLFNGKKVQVPFMTSYEYQFVREYDDFKVLGLPYLQGDDKQNKRRFTMYVYLPDAKDGLQSLVEKIGSASDYLERHIPHEKVEVRRLLIPKFKISFQLEVSPMLMELGLVLPFTSESDLTEIDAGETLYVRIRHKSFVEVCEEGTEAAAYTEDLDCELCSEWEEEELKKIDFVADHPFLFVIRDDVTGVVLFMGQVVDPSVG